MKRILVIDDEEQILNLLKAMFENEGYMVDTSTNGHNGLVCINNNLPDLIICDIVMPVKEGIETIIEIKKKYPSIKIIAISGGGKNNLQDYLLMAKSIGASKTLSKPFRRKEILDAVEELIGLD